MTRGKWREQIILDMIGLLPYRPATSSPPRARSSALKCGDGGETAPEIRRRALWAKGRNARRLVERREAQRPAGRPRKPAGFGRVRLAAGPRKPGGLARETGASQAPERGLANPWRLPALHRLPPGAGKRGKGRTRRPIQKIRAAERWLVETPNRNCHARAGGHPVNPDIQANILREATRACVYWIVRSSRTMTGNG